MRKWYVRGVITHIDRANLPAHFVDQVELILHVSAIAAHAQVHAQTQLVDHVQGLVQ
jgi:hypothetical protein